MSIRSDIKQSAGWHRWEEKTLLITITDANGDPVNLTGLSLLWRVVRDAGSSVVYLEKTDDITVTGASSNIATIPIDPDTDYEDLEAGVHRHELIDLDNNLLLSYGDCWVLPASAFSVAP